MAKARTPAASGSSELPLKLLAEMPRGGQACIGLEFSPDGNWLAAGAYDRTIHLYDVKARKRIHQWSDPTGSVNALAISPDSQQVAALCDRKVNRRDAGGELLIWNVEDGTLEQRVTLTKSEDVSLGAVRFAPSGKHVACVVVDYEEERASVAVVDAVAGKVTKSIAAGEDGCEIAFSPDGKTLAGGFDGKVVLWQFPSGKEAQVIKRPGRLSALGFAPDGKKLAIAGAEGAVTLYAVASGKAGQVLEQPEQHQVAHVQFSPDGKRLATIGPTIHGTSPAEVRIWDLKTGQVVISFAGRTGVESPFGFPGSCALSPDLSLFANAGVKARLWQLTGT